MSEFYRSKQPLGSPYIGWSPAKKQRFLLSLIKIARDNTLYGYASMVETKLWDSVLDDATKLGVPRLRKTDGKWIETPQYNPYHTCAQNFFARFPVFMNETVDPLLPASARGQKVAFVFHQHEVFGIALQLGYQAIQGVADMGDRLDRLTFGASEDYEALQAADLFVFYCRRRFTRYLEGKPEDKFESALLDPNRVYLLDLPARTLKALKENNARLRQKRETKQ